MKGVVADFVVGAHRVNSLPCRLERLTMEFDVRRARGMVCVTIGWSMAEMCRELLTDCVRHRRFVVRQARESRMQRAFTRRTQFATDRIIVAQVERA
jgi:hypothetical protein